MSHLQTNLNFLNSAINILLNRAARIIQARSALQRPSPPSYAYTYSSACTDFYVYVHECIWFPFVIALRVWSLLLLLLNVFYGRLSKTKTTTRQIPPYKAFRIAMRRFHQISAHKRTSIHIYTQLRDRLSEISSTIFHVLLEDYKKRTILGDMEARKQGERIHKSLYTQYGTFIEFLKSVLGTH